MRIRRFAATLAAALVATAAQAAPPPSAAAVGDADSFGRNVRWLGSLDTEIDLLSDCTGLPSRAQDRCMVRAAAPSATSFSYSDLNRITLPAHSTNSLLCQWWTPIVTLSFANPTAAPLTARVRWSPTLTVESSVLADPTLIDPNTGAPFGGKLETSVASSHNEAFTLAPGENRSWRDSSSRLCIAGALSKQGLIEGYGLSAAKANDVLNHELTIRLNVTGSVTGVDQAQLYFGLRFVGD
jgi:hypothetical protein